MGQRFGYLARNVLRVLMWQHIHHSKCINYHISKRFGCTASSYEPRVSTWPDWPSNTTTYGVTLGKMALDIQNRNHRNKFYKHCRKWWNVWTAWVTFFCHCEAHTHTHHKCELILVWGQQNNWAQVILPIHQTNVYRAIRLLRWHARARSTRNAFQFKREYVNSAVHCNC